MINFPSLGKVLMWGTIVGESGFTFLTFFFFFVQIVTGVVLMGLQRMNGDGKINEDG